MQQAANSGTALACISTLHALPGQHPQSCRRMCTHHACMSSTHSFYLISNQDFSRLLWLQRLLDWDTRKGLWPTAAAKDPASPHPAALPVYYFMQPTTDMKRQQRCVKQDCWCFAETRSLDGDNCCSVVRGTAVNSNVACRRTTIVCRARNSTEHEQPQASERLCVAGMTVNELLLKQGQRSI